MKTPTLQNNVSPNYNNSLFDYEEQTSSVVIYCIIWIREIDVTQV